MRVTQRLVAERAGVSQPAVSMILKGDDASFPAATRDRVRAVARELGYALRTRSTGNIGVVVPEYFSNSGEVRNRFYTRFLDGASSRARDLGVHVLLETWSRRRGVPDMVAASKVDGLILAHPVSRAQLAELQSHVPVVFLNTDVTDGDATVVMPDNRDGIDRAVRMLYDRGHRRFAFFGIEPSPMSSHLRERRDAFERSVRDLGLPARDVTVCMPPERHADHSDQMAITARAVDRLMKLKRRPTAVVSHGDSVMLGFLSVARERGWLCPGHFSAVGFDNIESCNYSQPPLTSVDQPMEQMAATALDELIAHIKDHERPARRVRLACRLVGRGSVGAVDA